MSNMYVENVVWSPRTPPPRRAAGNGGAADSRGSTPQVRLAQHRHIATQTHAKVLQRGSMEVTVCLPQQPLLSVNKVPVRALEPAVPAPAPHLYRVAGGARDDVAGLALQLG